MGEPQHTDIHMLDTRGECFELEPLSLLQSSEQGELYPHSAASSPIHAMASAAAAAATYAAFGTSPTFATTAAAAGGGGAASAAAARPLPLQQPLTKEEVRKLRNRESAAKSRQRAQDSIRALEDRLAGVQRRHEQLKRDVRRLTLALQMRSTAAMAVATTTASAAFTPTREALS